MPISPQGYVLGGDPKNINPFWGEDEKTNWTIEAEATVDSTSGSPSVNVETDTDSTLKVKTFTFAFSGLKGEKGIPGVGEKGDQGDTGNGIQSVTKTSTQGLVDTYTILFTDGTSTTFTVTNGAKGDPGIGIQGDPGNGISNIEKTSTQGLVDTYTISFTDGTSTTFTVTNGSPGEPGTPGTPGQNGSDGVGIQSITKTCTSGLVDTYTITFTNGTTTNFTVTNGSPGTPGVDGVTPVISATASVGTGTGTPSVSVTKSGTDAAPSFAFAFDNLKGAAGANGQGVPTGGTAGQVLTKVDGTDYNTQWSTPQSGGGNPIYRADSAATFLSTIYSYIYTGSNYFPLSITRIAASKVGFGYGNYVRSAYSYDRDGTALEQYFNSISSISFNVTNIQKPWLNGSRYCSRAIGRLQLTSNNVTYVYVGQFILFWMSASAIGIVPFGAFWLSNNAMHGECNLYSGIDGFFSVNASDVTDFEGYYTVGEKV